MSLFLHGETWIALLTLTFLEIVLGVDNVIFLSIVSNKLPPSKQPRARIIGLTLALLLRILLLLTITWIIGFSKPLISLFSFDLSGRDIILALGGLFLLAKSTSEMHHKMEGEHDVQKEKVGATMLAVVAHIVIIDVVFSLDSILTAVGLTREVTIMIIAVVLAMGVMMAFAGRISRFIQQHPTLEILALAFLILIGFMLIIDGLHYHVPKGYIYFAVFFSLMVEMLNMRVRKKGAPVTLRKKLTVEEELP